MAVTDLYSWLRRSPPAAAIRCDGGKVVRVTSGKYKWREALNAIEVLECTRIEALDKDGNVLRATEIDQGPLVPEKAAEGPETVPAAAEGEKEIVTFAKLLSHAYKQGAESVTGAHGAAFDRLCSLLETFAERATALENGRIAALDRREAELDELAEQLRAAAAGGENAEGLQALVTQRLLGGFLAGEASKANGKPKETKS